MATERVPTDRIIQALRETNGLISLAAKRVPCSQTTIYARARAIKAVQRVIDECRGELVDMGELALRKAVLNGEPWAVGLVLKTLGKDRGYTERHETSGPNGGPIGLAFDLEAWKRKAEERDRELDDVEDLSDGDVADVGDGDMAEEPTECATNNS